MESAGPRHLVSGPAARAVPPVDGLGRYVPSRLGEGPRLRPYFSEADLEIR